MTTLNLTRLRELADDGSKWSSRVNLDHSSLTALLDLVDQMAEALKGLGVGEINEALRQYNQMKGQP